MCAHEAQCGVFDTDVGGSPDLSSVETAKVVEENVDRESESIEEDRSTEVRWGFSG